MKYCEIYQAMERRWHVSPGFRFVDYSGWYNKGGKGKRYPLCLMMEDWRVMRRFWIVDDGVVLTITCMLMDTNGRSFGKPKVTPCKDAKHAAEELDRFFAGLSRAA